MGQHEHHAAAPRTVTVAVVTLSDSRSPADDRTGDTIVALLEAALERLAGCRTVRVHALMPTAGFYRALGFEAEGMSTRFRLSPEMHALAPFDVGDAAVAPAHDHWDEVLALDAAQFGGDRSALLEALAKAVPEAALALDGGYILAKGEPPLYELGPWVVKPGCRGWRGVLEAAVAALPRTASVEIIVPSPNFRVTSLLEAQGWEAVEQAAPYDAADCCAASQDGECRGGNGCTYALVTQECRLVNVYPCVNEKHKPANYRKRPHCRGPHRFAQRPLHLLFGGGRGV